MDSVTFSTGERQVSESVSFDSAARDDDTAGWLAVRTGAHGEVRVMTGGRLAYFCVSDVFGLRVQLKAPTLRAEENNLASQKAR